MEVKGRGSGRVIKSVYLVMMRNIEMIGMMVRLERKWCEVKRKYYNKEFLEGFRKFWWDRRVDIREVEVGGGRYWML